MLFKLFTASVLTLTLSGCIAYTPVKYATDKVCAATDAQQEVLAEQFDKATFPHRVRVECYVPEEKPKATFSE